MEKFISAIRQLIEVTSVLYDAKDSSAFAFNFRPSIELSYSDDFTIAYLTFNSQYHINVFMMFIETFLPGCSFRLVGNVLTVFSYYVYNNDLSYISVKSKVD